MSHMDVSVGKTRLCLEVKFGFKTFGHIYRE